MCSWTSPRPIRSSSTQRTPCCPPSRPGPRADGKNAQPLSPPDASFLHRKSVIVLRCHNNQLVKATVEDVESNVESRQYRVGALLFIACQFSAIIFIFLLSFLPSLESSTDHTLFATGIRSVDGRLDLVIINNNNIPAHLWSAMS